MSEKPKQAPPGYSIAAIDTVYNDNTIAEASSIIEHATAHNNFTNVLPGISGRRQFTRRDYEYFRPDETLPTKYRDIVQAVDAVYYNVAIVRNIVDLMGDFASQGIRITHPVDNVQRFLNKWFEKVQGPERSERFLSCLYRHGMVAIRILDGKLTKKSIKQMAKAGLGDRGAEIPLKYVFTHPALIEPLNSTIDGGQRKYVLLKPIAQTNENSLELNIHHSHEKIPLDPENFYVAFYKKDDWQDKPVPFLFPLIKHAIMLQKLSLADSAALDAAILKIRVWKLFDKDVQDATPTPAIVSRLDSLLRANVGGGAKDIIWSGPIELLESNSNLMDILGEEKYKPHLDQIYEGLGITASLTGSGGGGGTTNNYINLKIMMKRLRAGRMLLIDFWQKELDKIQEAMKISKRASIDFDHFDIGDEESERQFLLNLVDRNIISEERIHNIIGFDHDLERTRVMKEQKDRDNEKMPRKTSPYHDPMFKENLWKMALQRGYVSPKQTGLEVPDIENDKIPFFYQLDVMKQKNAGQVSSDKNSRGPGGRPPGAKDKEKRKTPTFNPKIKAEFEMWSMDAYKKVSDKLRPAILHTFNKNTLRELTAAEVEITENIKFGVLSNIQPLTFPSDDELTNLITVGIDQNIQREYKEISSSLKKSLGRSLTLEEYKTIQRLILWNLHYENI